jgi:inner membrane protein
VVAQGIQAERVIVTAAPLQTLLWRIVAVTPEALHEGFWSPCDNDRKVVFERIERGAADLDALRGNWSVDRVVWFSGGCCKTERVAGRVRLTDVRLGQEPFYVFAFDVAAIDANGELQPLPVPEKRGARIDVGRGLRWLWRRMWGERIPSPR